MGFKHFTIRVRQPFRLDLTVWALRRRPHNTVDVWDGTTYLRTLVVDGGPVRVAVRQGEADVSEFVRLDVEVRRRGEDPSEASVVETRHLLERMLGLEIDLGGFYRLAATDVHLSELSRRFLGVRPPRFASVFEGLVNAIACQQLSLTVGIHLLNRLAAVYGPVVDVPRADPGFPTPERLSVAEVSHLRDLGFSTAKARTLIELSRRVVTGALDLDAVETCDDRHATTILTALPGVGRWSAEYVLLRGLGRLGVLPGDDVGARNSLRRYFELSESAGYHEVVDLARRWSPYGGVVYFHLLLDGLARDSQLQLATSELTTRYSAPGPISPPRYPVDGVGYDTRGVA